MQGLARARKNRGWSQQRLADESGVHAVTIARIETGRHTPRVGTMRALAEALGVKPRELFMPDAPGPEEGGLAGFFESQRALATNALETIQDAKEALSEGHLDYAMRFMNLAKNSVALIEQAQIDALAIERRQTEEGAMSRQNSAPPGPPQSEPVVSLPQT